MSTLDWTFVGRVGGSSTIQAVKPIIGGTLSYDDSRTTTRQLTGFSWIPTEIAKINLSADYLLAYVSVDGATPQLVATLRAASSAQQKDVLTNSDGTLGDLSHVDFYDTFVQLNASSEVPFVIQMGVPPDVAMAQVAALAGLNSSFAGSYGILATAVTWAPFTSYATMLSDLAGQAGHRVPWSDPYGVARSVQANTAGVTIIPLATLKPIQGTIVVTDNYLTAPDRVFVYDQSSTDAIIGIWDAPASSPGSAAARGYSIATGVAIQGLSSTSQAVNAAQAYGEQQLARTLSVTLAPESILLLDGPNIISYLGANWLVRSWSLATQPGSTLSLVAAEVIDESAS